MDKLQKYRLSADLGPKSFNVADLLNEEYLKTFMEKLAQAIGAPNEKVAASIFIKRYAFIAVIALYSMTALNKKVNISLENIEMELPEPGKEWLPKFSLEAAAFEDWNGVDWKNWRRGIVKDLFAGSIFPILERLEKTFKISKLILWENIAIYIFWLYEAELNELEDFHYLLFDADGELFGSYNQNPILQYFGQKNSEGIRMRRTCCFTYHLSAGKRCKTCPCKIEDGRCSNGESICTTVRSTLGEIQ